jgi:hypothetical protein
MLAHGDEVLLRIFIGDDDIYEDAPSPKRSCERCGRVGWPMPLCCAAG